MFSIHTHAGEHILFLSHWKAAGAAAAHADPYLYIRTHCIATYSHNTKHMCMHLKFVIVV